MSAFGDLKYPADFKQFDYVNPNAPKGGMFSQIGSTGHFNQNFLTFNSLNSFILKGDGAQGMELTFASLMARAEDEPDAMYGLAARAVQISPDGLTYRFSDARRAQIPRRHAAHCARRRLLAAKCSRTRAIRSAQQLMREFAGAEAAGRRDGGRDALRRNRARDVPLFVAALADFLARLLRRRAISTRRRSSRRSAAALTRSASSSPAATSSTSGSRIGGARNLPVSRGQNNFDIVRYEYLSRSRRRLRGIHRQELSVPRGVHLAHLGDALRFSRDQGRPRQARVLPDDTPSGAQGWFFNTRREKFKNRALREALIYAFDFEWTNKTIMYGSYKRTHSVFQNSNMMADGKPARRSLRCSSRFAARCPTRCSASRSCRRSPTARARIARCCARRAQLLQEAGYRHQGRQARDAEGRAASRSSS